MSVQTVKCPIQYFVKNESESVFVFILPNIQLKSAYAVGTKPA